MARCHEVPNHATPRWSCISPNNYQHHFQVYFRYLIGLEARTKLYSSEQSKSLQNEDSLADGLPGGETKSPKDVFRQNKQAELTILGDCFINLLFLNFED